MFILDEQTTLKNQINEHEEQITLAEAEIKSKTKEELISSGKELSNQFSKLPSISIFKTIDTTQNILTEYDQFLICDIYKVPCIYVVLQIFHGANKNLSFILSRKRKIILPILLFEIMSWILIKPGHS